MMNFRLVLSRGEKCTQSLRTAIILSNWWSYLYLWMPFLQILLALVVAGLGLKLLLGLCMLRGGNKNALVD